MSGLTKARVIVAGAGALGSCIAVRLARGGARVTLVDPGSPSANASGIAAGMLAPAFERVLDPDAGASFDLLRSARDLWPGLARGLGDIGLRRTGALWLDLPEAAPRAHALAQGLERLGARVRAAAPPTGASEALFTPEDWRLDPSATLAALRRAFDDAGRFRGHGRERGAQRRQGGALHPARHAAARGAFAVAADGGGAGRQVEPVRLADHGIF